MLKKVKKKREKEVEGALEEILYANLDYELYVSIVKEFLNKYKMGEVSFSLVGPRVGIGFSSILGRKIMKEYNLELNVFQKFTSALMMTLHHVLSKEDESIIEYLIDRNRQEAAQKLEKKFKFIRGTLNRFPELREQYLIQTYCKSFFLKDLSWEADVKFSHSPVEYSKKEPSSPFPVGRIRIILGTPEYPIEELKTTCFNFEVSYYDVENMIRSLEDLKSSLIKLRERV